MYVMCPEHPERAAAARALLADAVDASCRDAAAIRHWLAGESYPERAAAARAQLADAVEQLRADQRLPSARTTPEG
jgi:hypothetical protein